MIEEKKSLYRKYRPSNFDELSGQTQVVNILKNAVKLDKVSHAYLFSGPRGTGKTSVAKIISKLFNCEKSIDGNICGECVSCQTKENDDILELDAASNNGVDEIRNIISKVNFSPNYGKYKVYIIDEVHMLSTGAFNALLKTLEEPPRHVIFILATTELHKIPKTILSRCQRYDFKKITPSQMHNRLREIANLENIKITDDALMEISETSDGAMRDAISMLDQISTYKEEEITKDDVTIITGGVPTTKLKYFLGNIFLGNILELVSEIDEYEINNKNYIKICDDLIKLMKDELIRKYKKEENIYSDNDIREEYIFKVIDIFQNGMIKIKNSNSSKITFELIIFEIISLISNKSSIEQTIKEDTVEVKQKVMEEPLVLVKPIKEIQVKESKVQIIKEENLRKTNEVLPKENQLIRVNNCLVNANKEQKNKLIEMISKVIPNNENLNILNIIKSSNIMVVSDSIIIFTTSYESGAERINELYSNIELFLKEELALELKIVGLSEENWKLVLEDYKVNKNSYVLKEEPIIFEIKKETNELESLLGSDLVKVN